MRTRLAFGVAVALSMALSASAQIPKKNPLVDAAQAIGAKGLGTATLEAKPAWAFQPAPGRLFVKDYVASLSNDDTERDALKKAILTVITGYEKTAISLKEPNDPATALAFSVAVLTSVAKEAPLDDAAFLALAPRFRAALASVPANDSEKQTFYEYALCSSGMVVSLMAAATDPAAKEKFKTLAETQLLALIGTKSDAITLKGATVAIKASAVPVASASPDAGSTAPGLRFTLPSGWRKDGVWNVGDIRDGSVSKSALVRIVPAVPAKGSFSDALRAAWKRYVPEGLQDKASGMIFRRYVGDGLVGQFICGSGPDGHKWDTLFTVYLIDCGATWQPIVVAQTWNDTSSAFPIYSPWTISGAFQETAPLVETFLKTLACPAAKGKPLIDKAALVGTYKYGSSSSLQYENVYTGATSMSAVSYGGTLALQANGAFNETYSSASGMVGAQRFGGFKAKGSWSLKGDILTLTDTFYDQGDGYKRKPKQYRVAGVVVFADGEKVLVLKDELNQAINPMTVGDKSNYFSTGKKN